MQFSLEDLSDGEKYFFIFSLINTANAIFGPILCFWDEPDNFLAPDEVGHSAMALRKSFQDRSVGRVVARSQSAYAELPIISGHRILMQKSFTFPVFIKTFGLHRPRH